MLRRISHLLAAAVALAAHAGVARGAEVQINPVVVHLSSATRSALVNVRNAAGQPVRFEVQVRAWSQSPAGEMVVTPTEDVIAFPPILALAPGEERNLRVGAAVPTGAVERTYRVFLQELPPAERPESPSQVRVLSRIGLPVFLAPEKALARHAVDGLSVEAGQARFRLENRGNVYVRPTAVKLVASDGEGRPVLEKELDAWYVLAGGHRDHALQLPAEACARTRQLTVTVAVGADVTQARAAVPAGACGP